MEEYRELRRSRYMLQEQLEENERRTVELIGKLGHDDERQIAWEEHTRYLYGEDSEQFRKIVEGRRNTR